MYCIYIYIYKYLCTLICFHPYTSLPSSPLKVFRIEGQHLLAFWSQHLQSRPMVLGGASLGGGIAMDFAVQHPEVWIAPVVERWWCLGETRFFGV